MSDDQIKLLEALEAQYGKRITFYAGMVFFDGVKLNMAKLEKDYLAWSARSTAPTENSPSPA